MGGCSLGPCLLHRAGALKGNEMVNLKIDSQQKISALGELLMVAAKSPSVNEDGMRLALALIDDLKAAVAEFNAANAPAAVEDEQKEAA